MRHSIKDSNLRGVRKSIRGNSNSDFSLANARSQKLWSPGVNCWEVRCAPSDHHWKVGGHPVSDLKMMMKVEEHRLGQKWRKCHKPMKLKRGWSTAKLRHRGP